MLSAVVTTTVFFISRLTTSEVIQLTQDNFNSFIKDNRKALIKFYVPSCSHCKRLAPEFKAASSKVHDVVLAEVNAEEEVELGKKFAVDGYPTVHWFDDGVATEYSGGFDSSEIVEWTNLMAMPVPVFEFDTVEEARTAYPNTIIVTNTAEVGTIEFNTFNELARSNRLLAKFIRLKASQNHQGPDEIAMYRKGEAKPVKILVTGQSSDGVSKFLKIERVPLFGVITPENFEEYNETGRGFLWVVGNMRDKEKYQNLFTDFAKSQIESYNVVFMDLSDSQRQADRMIGAAEYPVLTMMNETGPGRYILDKKHFTLEKMEKWLSEIKSGDLIPILKSEPVPLSNEEPLKIAVSSAFNDVVVEDRDVLLMIEAPWCGHCKKVQPTYRKVAEKLNLLAPEIIVAKIDGTANEIGDTRFRFQAFPTIFWKKMGSDPIKYTGNRSYNDFMAFVLGNASKRFKWAPESPDFNSGDEIVNLDEL